MKSLMSVSICFVMLLVSFSHAYLIQNVDLDVDQWIGTGSSECVIAVDWNATTGLYSTEFHIFGYRWDDAKTVADALADIDTALSEFQITTAYGGGFVDDIVYDQSGADGDYHTAGSFTGWWWAGETQDGGQSWIGNGDGITDEYLWDGGIEGINVDNDNWGSANMTIPEPSTMILLMTGYLMARRRK